MIVRISNKSHSFLANVGIDGKFSIINAVEGELSVNSFSR